LSKIILQPAGSKSAKQHFIDTIQKPVSIEKLSKYVNKNDLNLLKDISSNGAYVWGVTSGKNMVNKNKWAKIERGDTALFSGNGIIFASGVVTHKIHNVDLGLDLWGKDTDENTWEYIFFLDEIKELNIAYLHFNRAIGYKDDNIIQGFSVLDEEKSSKLFEEFSLLSNTYLPYVEQKEYSNVLRELDELDSKREVAVRVEQSYLRKHLLGDKTTSLCSICDREFNIQFLICAHIKKRSKCDDKEKLNINNVIPMCRFGCDELFERGFIIVEDSKIKAIKDNTTEFIKRYLDNIDGKICNAYNESNRPFFNWHQKYHNNK
tara:strand:+ start:163 stop:1122 length:960 start_codon:yes stop_codon:yes gene_type:complete